MKWDTKWWGVVLIAESNEDKELLKQLKKKLPKEVKVIQGKEGGRGIMYNETGEKSGEFRLVFDIS